MNRILLFPLIFFLGLASLIIGAWTLSHDIVILHKAYNELRLTQDPNLVFSFQLSIFFSLITIILGISIIILSFLILFRWRE